jgi:hypothetical protein
VTLRRVAPGAALAALGALVFAPAIGAGFLGDDFTLLRTLDRVGGADLLVANDLGETGGAGHFYRPVWVAWNTGLRGLFGDAAAAFHVANLLLFAVLCLLVWLLTRKLLDPARALVAAVAFALFPRHAESVAWISGSTDLLAVALALGALLLALHRRTVPAAIVAALALGAKEAAIVVPFLLALLLRARGERDILRRAGILLGAQIAVLVLRFVVLGGVGGYGEEDLRPVRVLGAFLTYVVASFSPPQLELLRHPVLLLVPVLLAVALGVAVWRSRGADRRVALAGLAWFLIAVAPVLTLPLDLNTANGERLLLLPSVGLALTLAAVLAGRRAVVAAAAVLGVGAAVSALASARDYAVAGRTSRAFTGQAAAAAPAGGTLVLLSVPVAYRTAHVFPNSADLAITRAGARSSRIVLCAPVHVRERRAGQIAFRRQGPGWLGQATDAAPFDTPVTRDPVALGPGCAWIPGARAWPGATRAAGVLPGAGPAVVAWWDGRRLRRATG